MILFTLLIVYFKIQM